MGWQPKILRAHIIPIQVLISWFFLDILSCNLERKLHFFCQMNCSQVVKSTELQSRFYLFNLHFCTKFERHTIYNMLFIILSNYMLWNASKDLSWLLKIHVINLIGLQNENNILKIPCHPRYGCEVSALLLPLFSKLLTWKR